MLKPLTRTVWYDIIIKVRYKFDLQLKTIRRNINERFKTTFV